MQVNESLKIGNGQKENVQLGHQASGTAAQEHHKKWNGFLLVYRLCSWLSSDVTFATGECNNSYPFQEVI